MFKDLHELAQDATLMITVAAEADQLRVSVTPVYPEAKPPANARRPLSILGTPAELDSDFTAALAIWQAPKRSVLQQAQDAASDEQDDETPPVGGGSKPKSKPGRKPKAATAPGAPAQQEASSDSVAAAADVAAVDTLTQDLFEAGTTKDAAADAAPATTVDTPTSAALATTAPIEVF
jgi:PRTRC genetic system protein E